MLDSLRIYWRVAMAAMLVVMLSAGTPAGAAMVSPAPQRIVALAFDSDNNSVWKAHSTALYRRRDEGRDWEQIPLPEAAGRGPIASIAISAHSHAIYVAGPGFGVLRSPDGGRSWVARNDGLPSTDIVTVTSHADQPDTVYAYLPGKGVFRSEDAGMRWRLMDAGPREKILQFIHSNMPGSMQTGWFFAATAKGVARSMDCFCGWRDAGAIGRPITAVAYDPREPRRAYAATGDDLLVSVDGGEQWTQGRPAGRDITALLVTPSSVVYAAVGEGELFRSADHGLTWHHVGE